MIDGPVSIWYRKIDDNGSVTIPRPKFAHLLSAVALKYSSSPNCDNNFCVKEETNRIQFHFGGADYVFTSPQKWFSIIQDYYDVENLYQSHHFLVATIRYSRRMSHSFGQHDSYVVVWQKGISNPVLASKIVGEVKAAEIQP